MRSRGLMNSPALVFGVTVAVATGVAFYLFTSIQALLGFVGGLQITLVSLQVEMMLRERRSELVQSRQIRLVDSIEKLDWMPNIIERMAQSSAMVEERYRGTVATAATRRVLERCANDLANLEAGHLVFEYEEIDLLMENVAHARTSIRAASLQSVDLAWWLSPLGRKYWQATLAALERGVHCERIFVYEDWNDDLQRLAREQADAGVHVLKVRRAELSPRLRLDLVVWDTACGYETRLNEHGEGQWNHFTLRAKEIVDLIGIYNSVYNVATELDGVPVVCILH
jgi:hypothetical protein